MIRAAIVFHKLLWRKMMPYSANVENIHRPWNKGKLLGQKPQNRENNCKPGETYRKTPSICKISTLYRANFAEDRHQHSRGGLSNINKSINLGFTFIPEASSKSKYHKLKKSKLLNSPQSANETLKLFP